MTSSTAGRRLGAAVVAVSLAAFAQAASAQVINAPLAARGKLSPVHPFPLWYQDTAGVQLEPCLDPVRCVLPATGIVGALDPALPFTYPDNFPSKAVYGYANIDMPVFDQGNGKIAQRGLTYTAQLLATFGAAGPNFDPFGAQVWTEISFVTSVSFKPLQTFTITHPYGVFTLDSDASGNLCLNRNQGGRNPCTIRFPAAPAAGTPFDGVLAANPADVTLGTFLRQASGAPAGFVGDGVTRGGITGSPVGQNFLRIEGPGVGTSPGLGCKNGVVTDCIEVGGASPPKGEGFIVAGQLFNPQGGPATQFWITDPATATPVGTLPRIDFSGTAGIAQTLTIRAVDANGNVDPSYTGTVALASTDQHAVIPLSATISGGTGTFSVTPHTALPFAITATDAVTALTGAAHGAVKGAPATALLVTQLPAVQAGVATQLGVAAVDPFGNVDAGFATSVSVNATDPHAILPAPFGLVGGQASFSATLETAGSITLTVDGGPDLTPGTVTILVTPGPAAAIASASGGAQSGAAGAVLAAPFVVLVTDQFGNPVPGIPVAFSAPGGGSVSAPSVVTGADGRAASTGTLPTAAGAHVYGAARPGLAGSPLSFAATALPGPPAVLAMTGPAATTAGVPTAIALAVSDRFGNPCTATNGLVTFTTSDASPAPSLATLAGGLGSASMTFHTAGPQTVGGALLGTAVVGTYAAAVAPDVAAALAVTLPADTTAGAAASFTVLASDRFGNVATGFTGPVKFSSSDGAAVLPGSSVLALGAGSFSATFRTSGPRTLTATSAAPALVASAPITVAPAAPATLTALSGGGQSGAVASTLAAPFSVRVQDAFGNVVPGTAVTFAAPAAPAGATIPGSIATDAAGVATASATLGQGAGSYLFTARVSTISTTFTAVALPGPAHHLALTPPPPSPRLDCECYDLLVQLVDAFENAVPGALAPVSATASGGALFATTADPLATTDLVASLPAPSATLTGGALRPDGSAHLHVCDGLPEVATITVSAPGAAPAIASASHDFTWKLGPVDAAKSSANFSLNSTAQPTLVAWSGLGHVKLRPVSACGNPIGAGQAVSFGLAGPGTLTPTVDAGDNSYTTTLNVTPCPAAGPTQTQVTARVNGVDLVRLPVAITCVAPVTSLSTVSFSRQAVEMCNDAARDQVTVTVTPRDVNGTPLGAGNTLAVTMAGLSGGAARDLGDGSYTATFSATSCGPAARPATVAVDGVDLATVPLTFTCSPVVASSSGVTVSGKAVADGVAPLTVTIAATNGCGEPAPGRPVTLASTLGTLAAASGTTDAAGTFITTITASASGQGAVSATVDGVALAPVPVSFDPKPKGGCGTGGDGGLLALAGLAEALRRRRRG